ncbi:Rieske 2Fe-2S domain-containing protein [Salininema proteolyticum]|uniref:Rieske 2Fe-2S domain-containing protein n=1 Tax=Salininema proteolyticum TaxID=1607685 RepID=A0ABV8U1T6_9ACTN
MRITGTGHASMLIETAAGTILTDPWVNPAYFASWFPFPDNSQLDWKALGRTDFLYVSHLHRDHFDADNLRENISKDTTVLLPEYPTSELEDELRELGFHKFIRSKNEEVFEIGEGVKVMIQALTSPTDGPIGDSSLWVEDADGTRLLNQNDARPTDLTTFLQHGPLHAHLLQFSGAIWYPMVYEIPDKAKEAFGKQKRERQFDRSLRYIDDAKADWVFPIAGPPCFLDPDLYRFNDVFDDPGNIFPDQQVYVDWLETQGKENNVVLMPGTVVDLDHTGRIETKHPVEDVREWFDKKADHLKAFQERELDRLAEIKASWSHPEIEVLPTLRERIQPLMEESNLIAQGVGGPVRFDLTADDSDEIVESVLFDFLEKVIVPDDGRKVRYRFRTERRLIQHLLHIEEPDWVNSLFLSCRFTAARIGQYNEFIYVFFKCLSRERLQYAEGWYEEQAPDEENITMQGHTFQRRCPHLKADLSVFGKIEGSTLTCQMHGWQWNLTNGKCITSAGHPLRVVEEEAEAHS